MYLVTGGAGFIGSAVVWRLNEAGFDNILVADNLASTEKWRNLVNRRYVDYLHRDTLRRMVRENSAELRDVSAVIHMGACSSTTERNADFLMDNNFHFSKELCSWALKAGARFVYASSAATYGDGSHGFDDADGLMRTLRPLNMYGYSKLLFDCWALREGLLDRIAGLKFFNVYGPNEYHKDDMRSVVCKAYESVRENGVIRLFASDRAAYPDGGQMRDFIHVKDCAEVIFWLLGRPDVNGVFNLGTGKARTWNDLANAVFSALELPANIQYMEMPAHLSGKYQYFTEATMRKLENTGCPVRFQSLEAGVADYVRNYLDAADPYL